MELLPSNQEKHLMTQEEREVIERQLGSLGLVDASLYEARVCTPHPEDRRWAVEFDPNPDIILGNN